ncbi:MAG: hypothetical protein IT290_00680 [Deltaproteobacteria bacterium]|nr:hypothetical protein [Deltaproteobacteria bacterium]
MKNLCHRCLLALGLAFPIAAVADLEKATFEFAKRGYFMAGHEGQQSVGNSMSQNYPVPNEGAATPSSGKVHLIALPDSPSAFEGKYHGFEVHLVNSTGGDVLFEAQDGRISVIQEAQTTLGEWKAIEYLPSSWCGNSYHAVKLRAGHMWKFIAPRYEGTMKTKLRFILRDGPRELRSNEFDGSVNPKQFTEKEGHTATNIMDPYNE